MMANVLGFSSVSFLMLDAVVGPKLVRLKKSSAAIAGPTISCSVNGGTVSKACKKVAAKKRACCFLENHPGVPAMGHMRRIDSLVFTRILGTFWMPLLSEAINPMDGSFLALACPRQRLAATPQLSEALRDHFHKRGGCRIPNAPAAQLPTGKRAVPNYVLKADPNLC
jgi:hypothetical protein